jgi:hypothetical protein
LPTGVDRVEQNEHTHNLVWTRQVPAGGQVVVLFEYTVEYPEGKEIAVV